MLLALATPHSPPQPPPSLIPTNTTAYSFFLSLLSQPLSLPQTKSVHAQILKQNLRANVNLTLRLHSLCCPSPYSSALLSFLLQDLNLLSFNLLIKHFSFSNPSFALQLFAQMLSSDFSPDQFTLPPVLNACALRRWLPLLCSIHAFVVKSNISVDPFVASALIDAYAKCGQLGLALDVLDELPDPDLPTYNSAITGSSKQGDYESALRVFTRLRVAGFEPNQTTLSSSITACGRLLDRNLGRAIHGHVLKTGEELRDNVSVNSALVSMYGRWAFH